MNPELTLIYMEWNHWLMIWKYRVEYKFPDHLINEAELKSSYLVREFENELMKEG